MKKFQPSRRVRPTGALVDIAGGAAIALGILWMCVMVGAL